MVGVLLGGNTVLVGRQESPATGPSVSLAGQDILLREDGDRGAPAIVLIHGLAASGRWWDEVVPDLARNHHVIRLDLLGHGDSAKPNDADYSMQAQARIVAAALDHLGVRRAVVVGHSTGGWVATALYEQRPELVAGLGLIGTGPRMDAYLPQGAASNVLPTPVVGHLAWRLRTDGLIRKSMETGFSRPGFDIPQALVDDVRTMTYHSFTASNDATDTYLAERTVPARLRDLDVPLLAIFGEEDRRWDPTSADDYRSVPDSRVELIADVGHSPMLEAPGQTTDLVLRLASRAAR